MHTIYIVRHSEAEGQSLDAPLTGHGENSETAGRVFFICHNQ